MTTTASTTTASTATVTAATASTTMPPHRVIALAVCAGLLTGLGEVALLAIKQRVLGRIVRFGPDVAWLAPVADAMGMLIVAFVLIAFSRLWRPLTRPAVVTGVFAFLGLFSLLLMYYPLHTIAKIVLAAGLAVQAGRLASRWRSRFAGLVRIGLAGAIAAVVVLGAAARVGPSVVESRRIAALPAAAAGAPNVLLIVWDTVRAQNLSLHGYARRTTPQLEAWARSSVVFDRASAPSPWTLPSHASMLTGRWAQELSATWETPLDEEHRTLAETLTERGYVAGGFIANTYYCGYELGLARGFTRYEDYVPSWRELIVSSSLLRLVANSHLVRRATGYEDNLPRRTAVEITDQFLDWQASAGGRPFFAFLNYFDAHETYLPPPPFDAAFGPAPPPGGAAVVQDVRRSLRFDWQQRPRAEIDAEINMYDGAIAYLDQQLDRLLRELQTRGVLDNTVVIVTSDHGEQFGEHGLFLHANSLYQPLLHVPLVIRFPAAAPGGARVRARATLRDIPATVLDLLGVPGGALPGRSLARHWSAAADSVDAADAAIAEVLRTDWAEGWAPFYPSAKGDMASVTDDAYHYIRNGDATEELYAIDDTAEQYDLSQRADLRPVLERFRAALRGVPVRERR